MTEDEKPKRPEVGKVVTQTVRIKVCKGCHCVVDDTGLCNYGCGFDGEGHPKGTYFMAVYERTDKFLGDEEG